MQDLNALTLDALFTALIADGCLARLVIASRDEDLGTNGKPGDVTGLISVEPDAAGVASIVARSPGVIAGLRCLPALLASFAPDVALTLRAADGQPVEKGAVIADWRGPVRQMLQAERTALNLLGRLSGVATKTAQFVEALPSPLSGKSVRLLDTRKTTPGLRNLEKYAVRCGGGYCHRIGLYDAVLIKDNHIAHLKDDTLARAVTDAATRARRVSAEFGGLRFIELEVDRLSQLDAVLSAGGCGIDIILLDNFQLPQLVEAVAKRDQSGLNIQLEASGGVNLQTIRAIAHTGVDRISVGALTHQATVLDLALDRPD